MANMNGIKISCAEHDRKVDPGYNLGDTPYSYAEAAHDTVSRAGYDLNSSCIDS
jgi:hypothetical protein